MTTEEHDRAPRGEYPLHRHRGRRRLDSVVSTPTATITISNRQFTAIASPSTAVDAGVTSITVTTTDDGEVRSVERRYGKRSLGGACGACGSRAGVQEICVFFSKSFLPISPPFSNNWC